MSGTRRKARPIVANTGLALIDDAARLFDLPPHLILEEYDLDHNAEEDRIRSIGPIK